MATFTSAKTLLGAALIGAVISYSVSHYGDHDQTQQKTIAELQHKIETLQTQLAFTKNLLDIAQQRAAYNKSAANNLAVHQNNTPSPADYNNENTIEQPIADMNTDSIGTLRQLETNSPSDGRPISEKVKELLAQNNTQQNIALACKVVFDLADNPADLPDYELESMYRDHASPALKRVIAQVLSQRGNNDLIQEQVAQAQEYLASDNVQDRQNALRELAKTHSVDAVNAIAPLLHDPNIDVKLDALLALQATGNESNIDMAEQLLNDPEPAVKSLASNVIESLKNLSEHARTRVTEADIMAELPAI